MSGCECVHSTCMHGYLCVNYQCCRVCVCVWGGGGGGVCIAHGRGNDV